jgi:hypothetical protein
VCSHAHPLLRWSPSAFSQVTNLQGASSAHQRRPRAKTQNSST